MKTFAKKDARTELRKEYDDAVKLLKTHVPGTKEYLDQLAVIERLHVMLMEEEGHKERISPNTILTCVTGGLQVVAILGREQFHNVTSKALGFVMKGRR